MCTECLGLGAIVSESDAHGPAIERCESCGTMPDDDAAALAVRTLIKNMANVFEFDEEHAVQMDHLAHAGEPLWLTRAMGGFAEEDA